MGFALRSGWRQVQGMPPLAADGLLAAAVLVLNVAQLSQGVTTDPTASREADALGYVFVALFTLPLALRRRFPRGVLIVVVALVTGYLTLGYALAGIGQNILIAAYTVASRYDLRRLLAGHAVFVVLLIVATATSPVRLAVVDLAAPALLYSAACWLGSSVRVRRRDAERLVQRTAQLEERAAQLEQARLELAEQAVTRERLRIARELHDVVAHSLSVIAVQSSAGALAFNTRGDVAHDALTEIQVISRDALAEMRRLLGVMRQDGERHASLMPPVGLVNISTLTRHLDQAGIPVRVQVHGDRDGIPAAVDLSAYRIVQEALTNVLKHAGATKAAVTIGYRPSDVSVDIVDEGSRTAAARRTSTATQGGDGIVGMRERVALFGGELTAGPRSSGGFRVHARLPYPERPQ